MAIRDTAASALEASGFELSILFLVFLGINLTWECTLAILKFLDEVFFGRGSLWIERVKEEILGLGVISLVLIFLEPELLKICVPDTSSSEEEYLYTYEAAAESPALSTPAGRALLASEDHHPCPEGKMHLFPKIVITASHFLLFYIAVVHIIYSFVSFSLTLRRFRGWLVWEHKARAQGLRQRYHLGAFATLEHDTTPGLPTSKSLRSCSAGEGPDVSQQAGQRRSPGQGQADRKQRQGAGSGAAAAAACCRQFWAGCGGILSAVWTAATGALDAHVFSGLRDLFLTKAVLTLHADNMPLTTPALMPADPGSSPGAVREPPASGLASSVAGPAPPTPLPQDSGAPGPAAGPGPGPGPGPHPFPLARAASRSATPQLLASVPASVLPLPPLGIADLRALHGLHFTNAAEQLVEVELTRVWAHAWALALFTAIFMLFPQEAWQAVWISGLSVVLTLIITAKMHAVLHAAALLGSAWPQRLLELHERRQQQEQRRRGGGKAAPTWPWRRRGSSKGADMEMGAAAAASDVQAAPGAQALSTAGSPAASPPEPPLPSSGTLAPASAPAPAYTPDSALQALNTLASQLLWFGRPLPLLWLINVAFVINSLSITIALYYLVAYQGEVATTWRNTLQTWIPLLVADTALALYLGAVVVPQYALVSACCGHSHASLMRTLRSSRRSAQEPEERGVSGLVLAGLLKLKRLCQSCLGRMRHRASGLPATVSRSGELALLSSAGAEVLDVFIRGLAFRAGVILPQGNKAFSAQHLASFPAEQRPGASWAGHPPSVLPLYREMVRVWMSKAVEAGTLLALSPDLEAAAVLHDWSLSAEVTSALAVLREAFSVIDQDGSGTVTIMELRERLAEVLEVKPTSNELRTMVQLIDVDSNKRICVREMGLFCAHEFFATGSLHPGAIDVVSLRSSLRALGLPPSCQSDECVLALLSCGAAGDDSRAEARARPSPAQALGLFKFASLFWDLSLLD